MYIGVVRILTAAPKISAVPTACLVGMPISRISSGVVIEPAPTPVIAIKTAMMKPRAISMIYFVDLFLLDVNAALELALALPAA